MGISSSYRHRDVIYPFFDAPELPVRVVWYEVPRSTPGLPYEHIFPLRDWDRLNDWIEPSLGTLYTKPEPYTGPDPSCACTTPTGTAEQWLNGLSYADYLKHQDYRGVLSGKGGLSATVAEIVDVPIIGQTIDFAGNFVPTGWLECLGQAVNRITYASLFAQLGTTWGPGDGFSTFNLPPGAGISNVGAGTDGDGITYNVGDLVGANTTTLITDNLPSYNLDVLDAGHFHSITDPGHTHTVTDTGHTHGVTDPKHAHAVTDTGHLHVVDRFDEGGTDSLIKWIDTADHTSITGSQDTEPAFTGIVVLPEATGITINTGHAVLTDSTDDSGITINTASTGIIVNSKGMGLAFSRRPPQAVMRRLIWPGP
jgi:microcystin-dependent protein